MSDIDSKCVSVEGLKHVLDSYGGGGGNAIRIKEIEDIPNFNINDLGGFDNVIGFILSSHVAPYEGSVLCLKNTPSELDEPTANPTFRGSTTTIMDDDFAWSKIGTITFYRKTGLIEKLNIYNKKTATVEMTGVNIISLNGSNSVEEYRVRLFAIYTG